MKHSGQFIALLFYSVILFSCIEPFNIDVNSVDSSNLVIDGVITDQPGPYRVKLSLSTNLFDEESAGKVSNAIVTIQDDLGKVVTLHEDTTGVYLTSKPEITGQIGRTYKLTVQLDDGRIFESTPEELTDNAGFSSMSTEYKVKRTTDNQGMLTQTNGFDVFVDVESNGAPEKAFYRWRWTGTYKYNTSPKDRTLDTLQNGEIFTVPKPWPCSGWVFKVTKFWGFDPEDPSAGFFGQVDFCTCCECWIEEVSDRVSVAEVGFVQTAPQNMLINYVVIDHQRFVDKYHIEVEQISLSRSGYEFWKAIESQQNQGSIFDATQISPPSNMIAINSDDKVLGYFGASSVKTLSTFIFPSEIPSQIPVIPITTDPCTSLQNSSNIKPSFW